MFLFVGICFFVLPAESSGCRGFPFAGGSTLCPVMILPLAAKHQTTGLQIFQEKE